MFSYALYNCCLMSGAYLEFLSYLNIVHSLVVSRDYLFFAFYLSFRNLVLCHFFYHISFFHITLFIVLLYILSSFIYLLTFFFILLFLYFIWAQGPFYFKSNLRPIWGLFFCSHQPTLGPIYSS